ncbi:hypothetical protein POM88_052202 [Heracleum sosnowskyi]|uniref:Uncharacterized protein n=1 Tax=Heracleum sosnowskyi TaxID=360622 RepID=A0AAD8LZ92_9APIA|nr:hypothetical protein POM88_052202 [Heracleum sosnowskyi]
MRKEVVGVENDEEIELTDIEDQKIFGSQFSLALSFVKGESALNEGGCMGGKVSEIGTLKEEVKDGDLNGNGEENAFEESENVEDQSCEEQYMVMSKQSNSKKFLYAVEAALDEVSRVVELETICSGVPEKIGKLDASMALISGFELILLVRVGVGKSFIAQY